MNISVLVHRVKSVTVDLIVSIFAYGVSAKNAMAVKFVSTLTYVIPAKSVKAIQFVNTIEYEVAVKNVVVGRFVDVENVLRKEMAIVLLATPIIFHRLQVHPK